MGTKKNMKDNHSWAKYSSTLHRLLFFALVPFLFISCFSIKNFECPYLLEDAMIKTRDSVALNFSLTNESEKAIESFTVFGSILSDEEDSVFATDRFYFDCDCKIGSFEKEDFSINLDNFFINTDEFIENGNSFEIGNLYILKIVYSDGSVWKDEYGIFSK